jgi:hypothetical protein
MVLYYKEDWISHRRFFVARPFRRIISSKSLFNISISRLFGLFFATLCQRSLRIFFEYAAFALPRLAKNPNGNPLKARS